MNAFFLIPLLWLAVQKPIREEKVDWSTNSLTFTNFSVFTNNFGEPFLTISNRPYVAFSGRSFVIRVTDSEWHQITNQYPKRIETNAITFYPDL